MRVLTTLLFAGLFALQHLSLGQPESQSEVEVVENKGIPAVDSDFLFMRIAKSTLPFEGAGVGVFAKVDILAGEILCEYRGATIPNDIPFESNYIYSSKKATGEGFHIVPDMKKPICAMVNDCVLITGNNYTKEELDEFENDENKEMPTYPGFTHNASPFYTAMGKVFVMSKTNISAGEEIFYKYGNRYWVPRIRYPQAFKF